MHVHKMHVHKMHVAGSGDGESGVVKVQGDAIVVGCGDGSLLGLDEVQLEGKRRMSAAEFLRGNQVRSGERLGL
jgi:methionyl-tRNA formyltransferase